MSSTLATAAGPLVEGRMSPRLKVGVGVVCLPPDLADLIPGCQRNMAATWLLLITPFMIAACPGV